MLLPKPLLPGALVSTGVDLSTSVCVADTTPAATPSATPPIITAADTPSATELALLSRDANEEREASVAKGGGAEGVAGGKGEECRVGTIGGSSVFIARIDAPDTSISTCLAVPRSHPFAVARDGKGPDFGPKHRRSVQLR